MLFLQGGACGLTFSCEKQKDASPFEPQASYLETIDLDDGDTSCVVRSVKDGNKVALGSSVTEHKKEIVEMLSHN